MLVLNLPIEIVSKIFLYLQCPVAKLVKNEIEMYEEDHNYDYTRIYKKYYIKNIMPFYDYYFDRISDPRNYTSFFMRREMDEE